MTLKRRLHAGLRPLSVCLAASLVVMGAAALTGPSARAAPPVVPRTTNVVEQGGTGTIKGKLVWGGPSAPEPKVEVQKGNARKDPEVCAQDASIVDETLLVDSKTLGVKNGIVYLIKPSGSNSDALKELLDKQPKVAIDQKNCVFVPHTLAIHQDQELVLKSSDVVNHNVHLNSFLGQGFNFILPPKGEATKKLVAEKRALPLTCDIHPWMKGNIMVLDHPFFAVTKDDGSFEIKGVPAGTQNLVIWQEAVGYVNQGLARGMKVEVAAAGVTDLGAIKIDPAKVK